jgi:hypothetical protein
MKHLVLIAEERRAISEIDVRHGDGLAGMLPQDLIDVGCRTSGGEDKRDQQVCPFRYHEIRLPSC